MKQIEIKRKEIEKIDKKLIEILKKRMQKSLEIAKIKKQEKRF